MERIKADARRGLPGLRPATDIIEKEDGFYIYLDMPGVSREGLVLDLDEDELRVSGRSQHLRRTGEKLGHVEFGDCEYARSFTLSHQVDRQGIRASLVSGVLEIFLPRAKMAMPRKIEIKAG